VNGFEEESRLKPFYEVYGKGRTRARKGGFDSMDRYVCSVCGYVYDPAGGDPEYGIEPGTSFEDLPDDWTCPVCGVSKDEFEKEEATVK